jgi:hypothetical protein
MRLKLFRLLFLALPVIALASMLAGWKWGATTVR